MTETPEPAPVVEEPVAEEPATDPIDPNSPANIDAGAVPAPAGQNLEFERLPHESDAEFMARTRHQMPVSESPTDIVPNRPNIGMGQPVPVEDAPEGQEWRYVTPPEGTGVPAGGEEGPIADQAGHPDLEQAEEPVTTEAPVVTTPTEETPAEEPPA